MQVSKGRILRERLRGREKSPCRSKKIKDYAGARPKGSKWVQDPGQRLERCAAGSAAKFVAKRLGNGLYLGIYGAVARGSREGCGRRFVHSHGRL